MKKRMGNFFDKKGIVIEFSAYIIIAIIGLAIMIVAYFFLKAKGFDIMGFVKNLLRLRFRS